MEKSIEKKYKVKMVAILILGLLVSAIAVQGVLETPSNKLVDSLSKELPLPASVGSTFTWEDDFIDTSKIDFEKSANIDVDTNSGLVKMSNTYKAWHYSWPMMKEINIQNSGSAKEEYVLFLENVHHEPEMEPDYSDLRFVNIHNDVVYDLDYWVGRDFDLYHADVWVRVTPQVPPGSSTIYMFYGDKSAPDHSNFDMIFRWDDRTDPDIMISYKNYAEGAWDPDVAYGNGRFLVAWEERIGPEDLATMERSLYCCIHGRTYNDEGNDPQPPPQSDTDIDISSPLPDTDYHAENPSIAYGSGKFFVAWEENPANIINRFEADIKGALVTPDGQVSKRFTICDASSGQFDPCVAYGNNRFFVVWEDARATTNNYDVWGRIFDTNGNPIGNDIQITSGANYQGEAWICSDDQGGFMIVYEGGGNPETGPFSLYAQKFDANGNVMMSEELIASGTSSTDYVFPSVSYNPTNLGRYFVTWNDGDYSASEWRGNIWGKVLNIDGSTQHDNFIVQQGDHYIRTDVIPFLGDMFFISYDGQTDLWGKLVYSNDIHTNEKALSDGSSLNIDWNNLAVSESGRIMAVWEDERDQMSEYADAFGSVWHIYKSGASPDISYSYSEPKELCTNAVLMSKVISSVEVQQWEDFVAVYDRGIGSLVFDIMNQGGTSVIHSGLGDISSLEVVPIRLRATFARSTPDDVLFVDKWSISYIGTDLEPPRTELFKDPDTPDGDNGWYITSVDVELVGLDDGSGVETIYYIIDEGETQISHTNPCQFTLRDVGAHTVEYWSVDYAGNIETPHNYENDLKIDSKPPKVEIVKPEEFEVPAGSIVIEAQIEEREGTAESGIAMVQLFVNGDMKEETTPDTDQYTLYYTFTAGPGLFYNIQVKAYDWAGNSGSDSKDFQTTPEDRDYDYSPKIGYWYTSSDSDDNLILLVLSCSLVVTTKLNLKFKPDSDISVDHVTFTIRGRVTKSGTEYAPDNEGYFKYIFDPPAWFYDISATLYDGDDNELEEFNWPGKVLFINAL